jgi:hypothetical protein
MYFKWHMHHYLKKFVSDLRQVGGFSRYSVITEILLKVALNTKARKPYNTYMLICNFMIGQVRIFFCRLNCFYNVF